MGNNKRNLVLKRGVFILVLTLFATLALASPILIWEPVENIEKNYLFLNATVEGETVMSFFDWNHSLLGYWNFETTNETGAYDNSSYETFGTFKGGNVIDGKFGHAFEANTAEYFDTNMNNSLSGGEPISVFAWVKDISPSNAYVVAQSDVKDYSSDWILGYSNGGLWCDGPTVDGNNIISDGNWHLLGFTAIPPTNTTNYNSTLYIDGNLIGHCEGPNIEGTGIDSVKVMARGDGSPGASGKVDEIMIWNRELNISEIQALYDSKNPSQNFTNLSLGNYTYALYAIDGQGNLNKSEYNLTVQEPVIPEPQSSVGDYILYYSFDAGDATDDSGNGHDGTLGGQTFAVDDGKINGAMSFDGVKDYIAFSDPLGQELPDQEWTVSAWVNVKAHALNSYPSLVYGWNKGLTLIHGSSGKPLMWQNNQYYSFSNESDLLVGQGWKHVTFVFRDSDRLMKVYVDGNDVTKRGLDNDEDPKGFLDPLRMGYNLDGLIDEFKVWDRVLSEEEVSQVYLGIVAPPEPDLVYPTFSYYDDSFSVIVENTNNTVFLELDNTNTTAEQDDNIFNVINGLVAPGNHTYRWWAYGNGANNNLNSSGLRNFFIEGEIPVAQVSSSGGGGGGGNNYECIQDNDCGEDNTCENHRCIENYEIENSLLKTDAASKTVQVDKKEQPSKGIDTYEMPEKAQSILKAGSWIYFIAGIITFGFLGLGIYSRYSKPNHKPKKGLKKILKKHVF